MKEETMNKHFTLWLSIVAGMIITIVEILFQCTGADITSIQNVIGKIAQHHVFDAFNPIAVLHIAIVFCTIGNVLCCAMTAKLIGAIVLIKKRMQSTKQESL